MKWSIRQALITAISTLFILSCGNKKKNGEPFFPVLSFIQSQVAHVDTSIYTIRKVILNDTLGGDTTYIPREQFRKEAGDFLSIPDLTIDKYAKRYIETKDFDQTIGRVLIVYTPLKPEKEEIQRQEVLIKPEPDSSQSKVTNFIINRVTNSKDGSIEKKMLWNVDKSFQVTTTIQGKNGEEKTSTFKIIWNEEDQR